MQTVRQKLESKLYNMGLFENQAKEIMDLAEVKLKEINTSLYL